MPRRRRPAAAVEEQVGPGEEAVRKKKFSEVNPRELLNWGPICIEEAIYYGKTAALAGRVVAFRSEDGEIYVDLLVSGTKNEDLLRLLSGVEDKKVAVHLCGADCRALVTDERLVHAHEFEAVDVNRVPWLTNLQKVVEAERDVDELEKLRQEQLKRETAREDPERKETRKEKKRKKKEEREEGRESRSPRDEREDMEYGQKSLEAVFKDTGMDPNPRRRAKLMKKARRLLTKGKKKKKKTRSKDSRSGTSGSSSTSSTSQVAMEEGLFDEEQRLQAVWRRYPGSLTARSLQEIKRSLVTSAGTMWNVDRSSLPPLYTQYGRQVVIPSMSPSLQQEALTLCQALDFFIQGRVAGGVDILNQRLKSIVSLSKGAHWTLGRQYELVKVEERGFAEEGEVLAAARRAKEDEKLRGLMRASAGKGVENSQIGKGKKGKEGKGTYRSQTTENPKGKGGGSGKDEKKDSWPKK